MVGIRQFWKPGIFVRGRCKYIPVSFAPESLPAKPRPNTPDSQNFCYRYQKTIVTLFKLNHDPISEPVNLSRTPNTTVPVRLWLATASEV
jgi:hypothetical protein